MDDIRRKYRKNQFDQIDTVYSEFPTKIKLIKPDGETNWIDISNDELEAIKKLLTE